MPTADREQCKMDGADFPCTYRGYPGKITKNVNNLRPRDIDVVAALGDSVIGSTGALAENIFHTQTEYRGVSFAIGARETWKTVMTLPNIIREFNPSLVGGSTNVGTVDQRGSNLNLAVPGADSLSILEQARQLVLMLNTTEYREKWKLVTIQIGHNDICTHPCNTTYTRFDASPPLYGKRLQKALDYLRDHLPRTFVNFVPLIDVTFTENVKNLSPSCVFAVPYVCPCLHGGFGGNPLTRKEMTDLQNGYIDVIYKLVNSNRYEKDDFTVVIQPAFTRINLFTKFSRKYNKQIPDLTYFGPDCLHPSQKLHALMARALWNNMLSPEGSKQMSWSRSPPFLCPTPSSPYLATRLNSNSINTTDMSSDFAKYMRVVVQKRLKCYI